MCAEKLKIKRLHIILWDYVGSKIKWLNEQSGEKENTQKQQHGHSHTHTHIHMEKEPRNPANKISMKSYRKINKNQNQMQSPAIAVFISAHSVWTTILSGLVSFNGCCFLFSHCALISFFFFAIFCYYLQKLGIVLENSNIGLAKYTNSNEIK